MTTLRSQIIADEGGFRQAYKDSLGRWVIGCGHDVQSGPAIKMSILVEILDDDIKTTCDEVIQAFPFVKSWDMPRAAVLVNMCFCMGLTRLLGFHDMLEAMSFKQWDRAARELRDSDFWRGPHRNRAERLARQLETGEWVTEDKKPLVA